MLGIVLVFTIAYLVSPSFKAGIGQAAQASSQISQHGNVGSSSGVRVLLVKSSLELWSHRPIFGFGTGSYGTAHNKIFHAPNSGHQFIYWNHIPPHVNLNKPVVIYSVTNPHNEFMLVLVQLGAVGLLVFLVLLATVFIKSFSLPRPQREIAQALVIIFAASCFTGSLLFTNLRFYFIIMVALLFVPEFNRKRS